MPTYVYKFVKSGETIEVQQSFTDDTLTEHKHPETGRKMAVKKVFQPVGVTFKGSGFFKNDNRGKKVSSTAPPSESTSGSDSSSKSDSSSSSDSGSKSDSSSSSDSGSKSDSSSSSKSNSSSPSKSDSKAKPASKPSSSKSA